ncbi:uncharacterized protein LOC108140980 [Drosophila elegans]|uniref:uncharacterized protein LOC108140980 n=1 Tax=Drosophila elegans TaxID=30023 RepID=UPI0007E71236|nr:uncharacterized protein LOC108140980 [Drosophila elegans]
MDLNKAESQRPVEERRSGGPDYLRILLQDLLCFFALLSVALLIVAGILFVVEDVSRLQQQRQLQHLHHRHLHHRDQNANDSGKAPLEEPTKQSRRCFQPYAWLRFFGCQKKQPLEQQEVAEKEVEPSKQDDQEQPSFDLTPTYQPVEPLRLRAGGDHVEAGAANKPHEQLEGNFNRV